MWAVMRNSGTPVNIKTVRRVMKAHNLSLPYAKHRKEGSNKAGWHKQALGN
ncbi:MAG: IS3 family transposase [Candidatus Thermoplasmatota archaeon]|nr:IS3 family transposase [Candidatus Thermoplasmatota archaeon]MCL5785143.1 IS3 family transposase [Candidatus Thermoplasmatota archaeon]